MASFSDDEEYTIPLQDKRVFGAGIKRKRVKFVPATRDEDAGETSLITAPGRDKSAAERYLGIVLRGEDGNERESDRKQGSKSNKVRQRTSGEEHSNGGILGSLQLNPNRIPPKLPPPSKNKTVSTHSHAPPSAPPPAPNTTPAHDSELEPESDHSPDALDAPSSPPPTCPICNLPLPLSPTSSPRSHSHSHSHTHHPSRSRAALTVEHLSSTPHQASLPHHPPPSHLPRNTFSARYLEAYGFDPDARTGLGPEGREGVRDFVKVREKRDTLGVGAEGLLKGKREKVKGLGREEKGRGKGGKLDAKQARVMAERERKRGVKMGERVWGRGEEVEALLRGEGG
ncbi:hypothetical protein MMC10_005336 [Thelotrema lepadinum]|nr:hypothetical protein [Thelotrema lepadinum]